MNERGRKKIKLKVINMASVVPYYLSPINLREKDISFHVKQRIRVHGINRGAIFDPIKKIWVIQSKDMIRLKVQGKTYVEMEYHVHGGPCGSEHALCGKKADMELHYVFVEESCEAACRARCADVCGGNNVESGDLFLVIGRFITLKKCAPEGDFSKLQVKIPKQYFEYDGSLTSPLNAGVTDQALNFAAVRWFMGEKALKFNPSQFNPSNTKSTRPLQPLDNRILLHN